MYATHNPVIANAMRSDLDTFKRGALFAILSIRQRLPSVPSQLDEVDRERSEAACLFGSKRAAYRYIQLEGERLWLALKAEPDLVDAFALLLDVPGLGIVKAGFVLQLFGYDIACIDSRNAQREGRAIRQYRLDKGRVSAALAGAKVAAYIADCGGKSAEYWDAWCTFVAPDYKLTPHEVSELHLAIVQDDYIPF